jgi:hypothetical protein
LHLLSNAWRFHALGCPVLIGHSRKRFLAGVVENGISQTPQAPCRPDADETDQHLRDSSTSKPNPNPDRMKSETTPKTMPKTTPETMPETTPTDDVLPIRRPAMVDRTAGTIAVALSLARQGVQILRVHDVAAVRQALLIFAAAGGLEPFPVTRTVG